MTKKPPDLPSSDGAPLTHNPFAAWAGKPVAPSAVAPSAAKASAPTSSIAASSVQPSKPHRATGVRLRLESKGRAGKVVTRITGLPQGNLEAIASRLRKALGCGATIEGQDLVVLGSLVDRVTEWLARAGDLRAISEEPRLRTPPSPPPAPAPADRVEGLLAGTRRGDIRRGQRVAIVLKADQPTGKLTEGVVRDLLTNSPTHPHGIKVRLESGEVGRVKIVY